MATFATTCVGEVRSTGDDSQGGFFDTAAAGADYSQQDSAQLSLSDVVTTGGTTVTSVTGGFTAAMIGNGINIAGTIFIITARASTSSITVHTATGTGTGQTGKVGGALLTIGKALGAQGASNAIYCKAGTYSITTTLTPPTGSAASPSCLIGYTATRTDGGRATISTASAIVMLTLSSNYVLVANFLLSGGNAATRAVNITGAPVVCRNVLGQNIDASGVGAFAISGTGVVERCGMTGTGSSALGAFSVTGIATFVECESYANACPGFRSNGGSGSLSRCLAWGNTGASSDGLILVAADVWSIQASVFRGNGRDGIRFDAANVGASCDIRNCVFVSNAGYGINSSSTVYLAGALCEDYNAFWNNTSGAVHNLTAGSHDVTLSGDPHTNGSGGDFTLNNTASAGAACRAAGSLGTYPDATGTGYLDIGPMQHQDPAGGGGGLLVHPGMTGGMRG